MFDFHQTFMVSFSHEKVEIFWFSCFSGSMITIVNLLSGNRCTSVSQLQHNKNKKHEKGVAMKQLNSGFIISLSSDHGIAETGHGIPDSGQRVPL